MIIGSNGKMMIKDIMVVIVEIMYKVYYIGGNFNNYIGLLYIILMMLEDIEVVVFEMGMNYCYEIEVFFKIVKFDIVIIMNIGEVYIEYFGLCEEIVKVKLEIIVGFNLSGILIYLYEEILLLGNINGDFR